MKNTKKTPDTQSATKTEDKFLKFWDDNGEKITHTYLVEATVEQDGKMYAKIDLDAIYSKGKDSLGILVTFGEKATQYFGASSKKLSRVFVGEPRPIVSKKSTNSVIL